MMTATYVAVISLTGGLKGVGHELYTDNFFSYSHILYDLYPRSIDCCGTIRQNHIGMPRHLDKKTLKLK